MAMFAASRRSTTTEAAKAGGCHRLPHRLGARIERREGAMRAAVAREVLAGERAILRQSAPPHVAAQRFAARAIGAAIGVELDAVELMRSFGRYVALPHVVLDIVELAIERRPAAAAPAGAQRVDVVFSQELRQHLPGRKARILAVTLELHLVAERRETAEQPPRTAIDALDLRVEVDIVERAHGLLGAEAAAMPAGAAGILTQRVALDDQRVFRLHLLARAVVRIAVIDRDGGAHAVFAVLGAPAAADQAAEI